MPTPGDLTPPAPAPDPTGESWRPRSGELAAAVATGALDLVYQPIVDLGRGVIRGAEALVRWPHPRGVMLAPASFLSMAEDEGLIHDLGDWVLETALDAARPWRARRPTFELSVNVSPVQLFLPDLVDRTAAIVSRSGWRPRRLIFELTESALLVDEAVDTACGLKELGARLCLDDFGTGYSSLVHLDEIPVDVVKVDRRFTTRLGRVGRGQALAVAVMSLARAIGAEPVAEGIETAEQCHAARLLGFPTGQGFFLSRPLTAEDFDALLAAAPDG